MGIFKQLITYNQSYTNPYKTDRPFDYGVIYMYVPHFILDGIVWSLQYLRCYVMCRYTQDDIQELQKRVSLFNKNEPKMHTELSYFEDDVFILGYEDKTNSYWCIYYDCDTSDCVIGRLKIDCLSKEDVIKDFDSYIQELPEHTDIATTLSVDTNKLVGYVHW